MLLATLSCVLARPGDISGGGGSFGGDLQLDSYAAPLPSTGGGSYPSGGPAPQYGVPQQVTIFSFLIIYNYLFFAFEIH